MGKTVGHPQLDIGEKRELNPVFLLFDVGCLELVEQQMLLAKANAMFELEALSIGLIGILGGKLPAGLAKNDEPLGFEDAFSGVGYAKVAESRVESCL